MIINKGIGQSTHGEQLAQDRFKEVARFMQQGPDTNKYTREAVKEEVITTPVVETVVEEKVELTSWVNEPYKEYWAWRIEQERRLG